MYPNPSGNRDQVNSLVNGLFVFCIRRGLPLTKNQQSRIGVELFHGSSYDALKWPGNRRKRIPSYQIKIIPHTSTHGVFRVIKDGREDRSMQKELTECIDAELTLATSNSR